MYPNHGQRVVLGQGLMQTASDVFLGWTVGRSGRHLYIRPVRDGKISAVIEAGTQGCCGPTDACALMRWLGRMPDLAMQRLSLATSVRPGS